jgi:hypothetical protein
VQVGGGQVSVAELLAFIVTGDQPANPAGAQATPREMASSGGRAQSPGR